MATSPKKNLGSVLRSMTDPALGLSGGDFIVGQLSIVEMVLAGEVGLVREALEIQPSRVNEMCPKYKITPIMAACGRGMERTASFLLSFENIDVEVKDGVGRSVFDHAAPFPQLLALLFKHTRPGMQWQEPAPKP